MPTTIRRTATAILAACLLPAGAATAASAASQGFDEQPSEEGGLFYGDFDKEISLFSGGTAEDFCNGVEPTHNSRVFTRADGSVNVMVDTSRQPIYLYSSPLGGPELVDATCEAIFDDDPGTVPLEPFAVGDGQVRIRLDISPDGSVHVVNSTVGAATSADGTTWKVRGWADVMIVDGMPVGEPIDFQGLRIAKTGA